MEEEEEEKKKKKKEEEEEEGGGEGKEEEEKGGGGGGAIGGRRGEGRGGRILAVERTDRPHYYPFIWCSLCAGRLKSRRDKEGRTECVTALCL